MCKAIEDMCSESYQQCLEHGMRIGLDRGMRIGWERTLSRVFRKMVEDSGVPAQEALDFLEVPGPDCATVVARLYDRP